MSQLKIVCSLIYQVNSAHAPYCHLWPARLYFIFLHNLKNGMIERKMRVLIFSTTFVKNISHSRKNSACCYHECTEVLMQNARYSCRNLIRLEFPRQTFEKCPYIKFYYNPSSGSRLVPCGRRDGRTYMHDEANSRYSNFAKAPINCYKTQYRGNDTHHTFVTDTH